MRIRMIKKTLVDGSDCPKCAEATRYLESRGLWDRIDEVVWAREDDPSSPGMVEAARLGVDRAPFFVVDADGREEVYTSVLQLVRDRLGRTVSVAERVQDIDADDVGGI
jgi:hypothetical protein